MKKTPLPLLKRKSIQAFRDLLYDHQSQVHPALRGLMPRKEEAIARAHQILESIVPPKTAEVAISAWRSGDEELLSRAIQLFGFRLLSEKPMVEELARQCLGLDGPTVAGRFFTCIGEALTYTGRGNTPRLTEEERGERTRKSNRDAQHRRRVKTALDRLQERFLDAERRLKARGGGDIKTLQEIVNRLLAEERDKTGNASIAAREKFMLQVKTHLKTPHLQPCPLCQK